MKTTVIVFLTTGLLAINSIALAVASKSKPAPQIESSICEFSDSSFAAVRGEDTAECLSKCKKQFDKCSDGGTKNIPACLEKRKKCIDACP